MVPSKDPPKVKLENLCNSRVPKLGENYAYLGLQGFWRFYSSIGLTIIPWPRRCFLVGEILFNSRILRNSFLIGVFLNRVFCGVQGILIRGAQVRDMMDPSEIPFTPISFIPSITYFIYASWLSHPCIDDLEAPSSILSWTVSLVESFRVASAKSSDTIGPSPLLRLQDLSLSCI